MAVLLSAPPDFQYLQNHFQYRLETHQKIFEGDISRTCVPNPGIKNSTTGFTVVEQGSVGNLP